MKTKRDFYQEITDRILAELETGAAPWVKDWSGFENGGLPVNATTDKQYRGINIVMLWIAQANSGFTSNRWLTFKQCKTAGGSVVKGSKGANVVFFKFIEKKNEETGEEERIPLLKSFTVFNVEQCEGLPEKITKAQPVRTEPLSEDQRDKVIDDFIYETGVNLKHGGGKAFYSPSTDHIQLPLFSDFGSASSYYATALHELTHWTGHKYRLDRLADQSKTGYAFEEMVAEMGAAFMCAEFGVEGELRHAGYIAGYIKLLKENKRAFLQACNKAQKAVDCLRDLVIAEQAIAA